MVNPVIPRACDDYPWLCPPAPNTPAPAGGAPPPPPPSPASLAPAADTPLGRSSANAATKGVTPATARDAKDVQTQQRLDSFRAELTGTYRTSDGTELRVVTPFQMTTLYKNQVTYMREGNHAQQRDDAAQRAQLSAAAYSRVVCGRGTPQEVHALAQALLDAQPAGTITTPEAMRKLMFSNCIGVDCAGYAQQAYLSATGQTRAQAGLGPVLNESLTNLAHRGFQRVDRVSELKPGDIVSLGPPKGERWGHRAIVYEQRAATPSEVRDLLMSGNPTEAQFATGGTVRVVNVDSSWGCGYSEGADKMGDSKAGGVERLTWLYNEGSHQWATRGSISGAFATGPFPYGDHPVDGFFRKGR